MLRRSLARPGFLASFSSGAARGNGAPRAFTLVELLVVIGIIAMLAALLTPVVMRSLAKARTAAIKAEIDMLHMAIMNYKNEYGSFPPCNDLTFALAGPASKHLMRLFPRCVNATAIGVNAQFGGASPITPFNAIVSWLGGFTDNPELPLTGGQRKRLYDFDQSRVTALQYHPAKKPGSPYLYINAANYDTLPYLQSALSTPGALCLPLPLSVRPPPAGLSSAELDAWRFTRETTALTVRNQQQFFNPDTFQILCAGSDEQFGTADDLSNFWPSTRQEYLDSLQ